MSEAAGRIGAAIDIGSNSVHLLVARIGDDGRPRVIQDESVLLGLGAVVDLDGRIPDETAAAVIGAVSEYIAAAIDSGAEWVGLLATEPLRRASNRSQFADAIEAATGRPLAMLAHEEEAGLTLIGVLAGEVPSEAVLVLDIGGGSSEIVLLEPGADPVVGIMPVGSARLTASHVEADPPTRDEVEALRSEAHRLLSSMPAGHPKRGTVTGGFGSNLLRLTDPEGTAGPRIDKARIDRAIELVLTHPSAELVESHGLRERRVLQMAAGASLIEATLDCYGLEYIEASDASMREGAIIAWALAGEAWRDQLDDLVAGA